MANNYSIALLSEPYVGSNTTVHHIQGVDIHQFPTIEHVKACVLIKQTFGDSIGLTQLSTSNLAVVQLKVGQRKFHVASAYVEPDIDKNNTMDSLTKLLHETRGSTLAIGGDFNGSHYEWGCLDSDGRGEEILDLMTSYQLSVCNTGNTPTFEAIRHGKQCSSIVDVTFVSDNILNQIDNWRVNRDACPSSDHNAVEFDVSNLNVRFNKKSRTSTYYFNNKTADWKKFDETLDMNMQTSGILSTDFTSLNDVTIDNLTSQLTELIRDSCRKSMKIRGNSKPYNPWWSDALERLKKNVIRIHHKLSSLKSRQQDISDTLQELQYAKKAYAKSLRKASTENFREFCNKQNKEDVWSLTNRLIKDFPTQRPPSTLKIGPTFTTSPKNTADALLNHFYPDDNQDSLHKHHVLRQTSDVMPDTGDEPLFTEDEVLDCLKTMNPNRAPGVDNLTSDICLRFAQNYPKFLTSLFNQCLNLGHFPTSWKVAYAKILPKPGKTDYSELTSFRPIGLLPIFGKVLEKLFIRRLTFDAMKRGVWSKSQFGFREQTSTTDALRNAIVYVENEKDKGRQVIGVSLDIKAAFDNAWWPMIFEMLRRTQCPQNIFKLIKSYFQNRKVTLNVGDAQSTKTMTKGCVQGSVCGPTFWNLILDELLETKLPKGCNIQAFADDVLLIISGKDSQDVERITNEALNIIYQWGLDVKLNFSPSKTKAIPFTNASSSANITFNGERIKLEEHFKILGVIIDKRLTFHEHVKHAIAKAAKVFRNLCKFVRPTWGVHSDNVTIIYKQVIQPMITYAAGIWGHVWNKEYVKRMMRTFQRGFALRAIRAFHTVSSVSALALAQFMPLHLKIREVYEIENVKVNGICPDIPEDVTLERRTIPTDRLHPVKRRVYTHQIANSQSEANHLASDINIYTDGSKLEDGDVGSAYVVYNNGRTMKRKFKLNRNCSVFQAELFAINEALIWANKYVKREDISIYSDSQSALHAIENIGNSHPLVTSIHEKLEKLNQNVRFIWVKAHIGIEGNEEADVCAKSAATQHTRSAYNNFPLSLAKRIIRENAMKDWEIEYEHLHGGKGLVTREWFPKLKDVREFTQKSDVSFAMTQILTEHGYHKQYLKRFKIRPDDTCPCNNTDEQTMEHLLKHCPKYSHERLTYERECHRRGEQTFDLIKHDSELIKTFETFIKEIIESLKAFNV